MASRATQIFVLDFSKDFSSDQGDKFTDGGSANQTVILEEAVGISYYHVPQPQRYCQFSPTSKGLLKLMTDFLMLWCMHSSIKLKKMVTSRQNMGILGCQWVFSLPGGCCNIIILVSEVSRAWLRGCVAFLFSRGLAGAMAVMLAVRQVLVLVSAVPFSVCKSFLFLHHQKNCSHVPLSLLWTDNKRGHVIET